jgi:hemolysin activation/secretion protein
MKWLFNRIPHSVYLFFVAGMIAQQVVHAATALPDTGSLPQINPQPALPTITSPDIQNKDTPQYPAAMPKSSGLKIQVDRIIFSGNRSVSEVELNALLQPFLHQSMDFKALQQLSERVTRHYRRQGYLLAEAYFPEQEISQNTLRMVVLEGYLASLKLDTTSRLDTAFLTKMANRKLAKNDAITESNLVNNLTLLNSLPAMRAVSTLSPGAQLGSSDVNIELQALPLLTGYAAMNTYGNRFTGRETLLAGFFLNNLAGRGDQLGLHLRNSNHERQQGAQLVYGLPIHASGTLLNLSAGYSQYRLGGDFASLGATGRSWSVSAFLDQPMLRSRKGNITARVGVSYQAISDDVSAFSLKNQRGINALEFGLFGDWRDTEWNGLNQLGFNMQMGEVDFKNALAQALDDTGAKTDGNFVKYNVFASRIQSLNPRYNLSLRVEYQGVNQNLDSAEKIAIGGINRWRQFAELPVSADRGLILGAELRRNMVAVEKLASFLQASKLSSVELSPYTFVDVGRGVINHHALSENEHVNAVHYGAGLDIKLTKSWQLDLAVSHQRSKIDGIDAKTETRAWGQIGTHF